MEETTVHAYAAGLIDGEGTITLSKNSRNDRFRLPVVSMTSTTPELVVWMQSNFGGSIRVQRSSCEQHAQSWIWSVKHDRALELLRRIEPFVKVPEKRRRTHLLLDDFKALTPRNGKYTHEAITAKEHFEHEFFHPSAP